MLKYGTLLLLVGCAAGHAAEFEMAYTNGGGWVWRSPDAWYINKGKAAEDFPAEGDDVILTPQHNTSNFYLALQLPTGSPKKDISIKSFNAEIGASVDLQGKGWSGRALIEGLRKIKNLYNISDENLFFYGYSAGGQCSNLFPAAMPERTRAYVSHASGVFHKPNPNMMGIPALLTCGDADHARYVINKKFIGDYRKLGVNILWKSFYNHTHDIPSASQKLARDFFRYCHRKYEKDLYSAAPSFVEPSKILYVGDDIDGTLYDADSIILFGSIYEFAGGKGAENCKFILISPPAHIRHAESGYEIYLTKRNAYSKGGFINCGKIKYF